MTQDMLTGCFKMMKSLRSSQRGPSRVAHWNPCTMLSLTAINKFLSTWKITTDCLTKNMRIIEEEKKLTKSKIFTDKIIHKPDILYRKYLYWKTLGKNRTKIFDDNNIKITKVKSVKLLYLMALMIHFSPKY